MFCSKTKRSDAGEARVKHSTVAYTIVSIYAVPFDGAHGIGVQTRYKSI